MGLGFRFAERMEGTYRLVADGAHADAHPFVFSIECVAASSARYIRDGHVDIEGTVEAPGFANEAPLKGTMFIRPFLAQIIRYEFRFLANDNQPYRFRGEKHIQARRPIASFTHLRGSIYNTADETIARCDLQFDIRHELAGFLRSWRPAYAR